MHETKETFYPLLEDFVFKRVFGDKKNTAKLALLLEPLLPLDGEELSTLKIENTFAERSWKDGKLAVLDILAGTRSGRMFDVEVQVQKTAFFHNRLVYYQSRLLADQLRKGHRYGQLRPVYCIAICNFIDLPSLPGYIHYFEQREEKSGTLFTDLQNMVIIELPKMPRENDGSGAWPVLECFRCKTEKEAVMLAKAYPKIREIVADLREFSLAKEFHIMREMRWKAHLDRIMWQDEYRMRGLEEGLEEGAAREREKWEAVRSENESLRKELERLRGERSGKTLD
jgi:predicted transposase/invertase (TIGR01784 family)